MVRRRAPCRDTEPVAPAQGLAWARGQHADCGVRISVFLDSVSQPFDPSLCTAPLRRKPFIRRLKKRFGNASVASFHTGRSDTAAGGRVGNGMQQRRPAPGCRREDMPEYGACERHSRIQAMYERAEPASLSHPQGQQIRRENPRGHNRVHHAWPVVSWKALPTGSIHTTAGPCVAAKFS